MTYANINWFRWRSPDQNTYIGKKHVFGKCDFSPKDRGANNDNNGLKPPPSHDTCTCTKVSLHETSWVVGTSRQIIREHLKAHVFHKTLSPNCAHSPLMQGCKVHLSLENSAKCSIDHLRHRAKAFEIVKDFHVKSSPRPPKEHQWMKRYIVTSLFVFFFV